MNMNGLRWTTLAGALLPGFIVVRAAPAHTQLLRSTAKVGTTAGQFLKIGVGARALGTGGAQVAVTEDISSIYWNPAALSRLNISSELTFDHVNWLADIGYHLRDSEQGVTWGVGLHYGITNGPTIKLDYGFADYGRLLNVQYLSLGVRL